MKQHLEVKHKIQTSRYDQMSPHNTDTTDFYHNTMDQTNDQKSLEEVYHNQNKHRNNLYHINSFENVYHSNSSIKKLKKGMGDRSSVE